MPQVAPSTALTTVADYLTDARVLLQDVIAPFRYDDASLVTSLNIALLQARHVRPDLFVYKYCGEVPQFATNDSQNAEKVWIEPQFRLGILFGMVSHAFARDQEDIQDAKSNEAMQVFNAVLMGLAIPPIKGAA